MWSTGLRTRRRSHPGWLSLLREMSRSCGIAWGWITGSWPLLSGPQESVIYSGSNLHREDFAHLQVARSVVSIAYLPLFHKGQLAGAIELLSFSEILSASDLDALHPLLSLGAPAILGAENFEEQNRRLLDSVRRLTQLYDLEKSLNATLELDRVITLIPRKVLPILSCEAVHLWLFDGATLTLMSTNGSDATVRIGMTQAPGEGYVADTTPDRGRRG